MSSPGASNRAAAAAAAAGRRSGRATAGGGTTSMEATLAAQASRATAVIRLQCIVQLDRRRYAALARLHLWARCVGATVQECGATLRCLTVARANILSIGRIIRRQRSGQVLHRAWRLWLSIGHRCSCSAGSSTRCTAQHPLAGQRRRSRSTSICRLGSCRHACAVYVRRGCMPTDIRLSQALQCRP